MRVPALPYPALPPPAVVVAVGCLLLGLVMAGCGGGGGSGSQTPALPTGVSIQGQSHAGRDAPVPLAFARCDFNNMQDGVRTAVTKTTENGVLNFQLPLDVQGFVRCRHADLPRLVLSAFISTVGQVAGTVMKNEDVTPGTTVIADQIIATNPADPQSRKADLLEDLARGEPSITVLVETAETLFQAMLQAGVESQADFSGDGTDDGDEGDAGDGGDAGDDGGAGGEAGDGGEFSPIPSALCTFSLDFAGQVRANTVLGDVFADGQVDRLDLQPIAEQINSAIDATRRREILQAFAVLFPTGLGEPLQATAAAKDSPTPGTYFLPYPPGVSGVIQCRPSDQQNLVLTTCVPARERNEIIDLQDVTPVTSVICELVTEVQQAGVRADRNLTKISLESRIAPLRIFLSEDRNGNGLQDADERDKNGDGDFATVVEIASDELLTDDNRDLALLVSVAATIFDTMRIETDHLLTDATFEQAREDFFIDGRFSEALLPLEAAVEDVLADAANQTVLGTTDGTTDVVIAATTGTLRGTVMDESGQPVAGVQVVVSQRGAEVEVVDNPATTAADGTFRIRDIPIGDTTVTAFLGEFEVLRVNTNVVAIVTIDLEIMPTPTIGITPVSLIFGEAEVGSVRLLSLTLANTGMADLTVSSLELAPTTSTAFSLGNSPTLPVSIASGASVTVEVSYAPTTVGAALGTLRIMSDALNVPEADVALIGTAVPQPVAQIVASPVSLSLGAVEVGSSRTRSVRLLNTGTANLIVQSLRVDSPAGAAFGLNRPPSLPVTVVPGAEVSVGVRYEPATVGSVTGRLRVGSTADAMPEIAVALSGNGVPAPQPEIELSSRSLAFGAVQVRRASEGAVTVTKSVEVRNRGTANLILSALQVESAVGVEFTLGQAPSLPVEVAPGSSVTIQVRYQPSIIGSVTGALHLRNNASSKADLSVGLTGTGVLAPIPQIAASTSSLDFGEVEMTSSRVLNVGLRNTGNAVLTVNELVIASSHHEAFSLAQSPTLPVMLTPGAEVKLGVRYRPSAEGSETGRLEIRSDADTTPKLTVVLSGAGVPVPQARVDVNPRVVFFAEVQVGTVQIVPITIANSGTADFRLTSVQLTTSGGSDFALVSSPQLPVSIRPNASTVVSVRFAPSTVMSSTGTVHLFNDSPNTPEVTVALSGTGVAAAVPQISVMPLVVAFGEVEVGTTRSIVALMTNTGSADLQVNALDLQPGGTGAFRIGSAPSLPVLITPGASLPIMMVYEPEVEGSVTATLRIGSNAADKPDLTVALGGTGVAAPIAQLVVSPLSLVFGEVQQGTSRSIAVTIANKGTADLAVTGLFVDDDGGGGETAAFSLRTALSLPVVVTPDSSIMADITFDPMTVGSVTGSLHIATNVAETPVSVALSGTGVAAPTPQIAVSLPALAFGEVQIGATRTIALSVTNTGTADLTVQTLTFAGAANDVFRLDTPLSLPVVIAPGASIPIDVSYLPTAEGSVTGTMSIGSDAANTPVVAVALSGIGTPLPLPQIIVSLPSVAFGEIQVRTTQTIELTISNPGTADLTVTSLVVDGGPTGAFDLGTAPTLPVDVAPSSTIALEVVFSPTTATSLTGTLVIGSNAPDTPSLAVALSGTGAPIPMPQIAANPLAPDFGQVQVGLTRTISVSWTNPGTGPLTISALTLAGSPAFRLARAPTLPVTVEAGAAVMADVVFAPTVEAALVGTLAVTSDAVNAPSLLMTLSGSGTPEPLPQIVVSPETVAFGDVQVGSLRTIGVTVSNPGSAPLVITGVAVDRDAAQAFSLETELTASVTVAPAAATTLNVVFEPGIAGTVTGTLRIDSTASSVIVPLRGTGVEAPMPQIVASVQQVDFGDVGVGELQTLTVTISNPGNAGLAVTSSVTAEGAASGFALDATQPATLSIDPNTSADLNVGFTPVTPGTVTGVLRLEHNVGGTPPVTIMLSGTGVAALTPQMVVSPLTWSYGEVEIGQSQMTDVMISNPGDAELTVSELTVDSDVFRLGAKAPSVPVSVVPGGTLTVAIVFEPLAAGAVMGQLQIVGDAPETPTAEVNLDGSGVARPVSQVTVSALALEFNEVEVAQSQTRTVQITNSGSADLMVTSLTLEGDAPNEYALDARPSLPLVLIPAAQVTVGVVYNPTQAGRSTASLRIGTDNPSTSVVVVGLGGTGVLGQVAQIAVTPSALSYGTVSVGSSPIQTVLVSNSGTAVLTISSVTVTSSETDVFGLSAALSLPLILNPKESVDIGVRYSPTEGVSSTGTLEIVSDTTGVSTVTVELSGTGVTQPVAQIRVTPAPLSFGDVAVGARVSLLAMVENIGTADLALTSVSVESGEVGVFTLTETVDLSGVIPPSGSQIISVTYQPTSPGTVAGVLRIGTDVFSTPEVTIALDGNRRAAFGNLAN